MEPEYRDFEAGIADTVAWYRNNGRGGARRRPKRSQVRDRRSVDKHGIRKDARCARNGDSGLTVLDVPVHGDNRGWFKENWQREKLINLGLPDLGPVQNNISFTATSVRQGGSTPNPGISSSRWRPVVYSGRGSICAPAMALAGSSRRRSIRRSLSSCRGAW